MTEVSYKQNQRLALQLLDYRRWLPRELLRQPSIADKSELGISSAGSVTTLSAAKTKNISKEPLAIFSPTTRANDLLSNGNQVSDNTFAVKEVKAGGLSSEYVVSSINHHDIHIYTWQTATVVRFNLSLSDAPMTLLLPPCWGTKNHFRLWQSDLEQSLLINALRTCGLDEIAEVLQIVGTTLQQSHLTLSSQADEIIINGIESGYCLVFIPKALAFGKKVHSSLQNKSSLSLISIIHPYCCLQNPADKARLWEQLLTFRQHIC
ncbi:MAG: hypothetical protein CSA10_00270 [Cardiobacteriales bacterium]|nr:MAG: hypothetical protein CSA10_00270 [Cardiobacteriales bacterium]